METQKYYVATGRSKTLASKHLNGLAVDFCFLEDLRDDGTINWTPRQYQPVVEFAEFIGLRSGARFGDDPDTPVPDGWDLGHLEEARRDTEDMIKEQIARVNVSDTADRNGPPEK